LAINSDCFAGDSLIGTKCLPPQSFRENHYLWSAWLAFIFSKRSAQQRRDSKQLKCIWSNARREYGLRSIFALHHAYVFTIKRTILQGPRLSCHVAISHPRGGS